MQLYEYETYICDPDNTGEYTKGINILRVIHRCVNDQKQQISKVLKNHWKPCKSTVTAGHS